MTLKRVCIVVMAHNEERRIGLCLGSLPLDNAGVETHVIVNGTTDKTAALARGFTDVHVHEYEQGGKARSWNRFVLDEADLADVFVFVDGDAQITPGSIDALLDTLDAHPHANAAAGLPCNGRGAEHYRALMIKEHGLFGDLYALRGSFVASMRERGVRLPDDIIGDDSLIGALVKTDLQNEDYWCDTRVQPCPNAGFLCEPTRLTPASLKAQYNRLVNYAVRGFQNRIITDIMRGPGPGALPQFMASHYADWIPRFTKRWHPLWYWVDSAALKRMVAQM